MAQICSTISCINTNNNNLQSFPFVFNNIQSIFFGVKLHLIYFRSCELLLLFSELRYGVDDIHTYKGSVKRGRSTLTADF